MLRVRVISIKSSFYNKINATRGSSKETFHRLDRDPLHAVGLVSIRAKNALVSMNSTQDSTDDIGKTS
jgi:hypothetical protein